MPNADMELPYEGAKDSGYNMTTEAAVAKLSYLLSQDLSTEQIREFMETDLRGELDR